MAYLLTLETPESSPGQLLTDERRSHLQATTDPFLVYRQAAERFRHYAPVEQMLLTDLTVQLPFQFLPKVDRATMSAGIEARVPFLDEGLVRPAVNLPASWKVTGLEKKRLLRESQRGRIPDSILDSPKVGFSVPYGHWLRTSLREFVRAQVLDPSMVRRFNLDAGATERMIAAYQSGREGHGFTLWKLLQLALWHHGSGHR